MHQFVCLLSVLFAQVFVNAAFPAAVDRDVLDTLNDGLFLPDPTDSVGVAGTVSGWNVFFKTKTPSKTFYAVIFRPESGATYSVVGFTDLGGYADGLNSIELDAEQQFDVLPGDVVGFYHAGGSSVPFDYYDEGCDHNVLVIQGTQDVTVGNDYTFSEVTGQDCRDYSLNVQIRFGNDATDRTVLDHMEAGVFIPDRSQAFEGSATVTGWSLYIGEGQANRQLVVGVFRPVGGTKYSVVGSMEVSTTTVGLRSIQLTPEQFIQVQEGDRIGFAYSGYGIIPFDYIEGGASDMLIARGYNDLAEGVELDLDIEIPTRFYSLAAIVS